MRGTQPTRPLLASLALLALAACNTTPPSSVPNNPYAGGAQYPWTDTSVNAQATLINGFVSDQAWAFASNGWGPIELDRSNGEQAAGDGRTITMNGKTFAKGLGVHANSRIRYNLNGQCQSFQAVIGVDDEIRYQNQYGSVIFEVWADGTKLYDSGLITQATPNKTVLVDTFGRTDLTLVVNQANENNWFDHANWADARVNCQGGAPGPLPNERYLTDLKPIYAENGWGSIEYDTSNGEQITGDGRTISIRGKQYLRGLGVHAFSEVRYNLNGQCSRFKAIVGIDDEVNGRGSVQFRVYTDLNFVLFDSGIVTGSSAAKSVDVDVTNAQTLILQVDGAGDGISYDHADWADARLTCTGQALPSNLWPGTRTINVGRNNALQLATDSTGAFYVGGQTLNPGTTNQLFVSKYDPKGTLVWTRQFGDRPAGTTCPGSTLFGTMSATVSSVVVAWVNTANCPGSREGQSWFFTRLSSPSSDGTLLTPAVKISDVPTDISNSSIRIAQDDTATVLVSEFQGPNAPPIQRVYVLSSANTLRSVSGITATPGARFVDFGDGPFGDLTLIVTRSQSGNSTLEYWTQSGTRLSSRTFDTSAGLVSGMVVGPDDRQVYVSVNNMASALYAFYIDGVQRYRLSITSTINPYLFVSPSGGVFVGDYRNGNLFLTRYTVLGESRGELALPIPSPYLWGAYANGNLIVVNPNNAQSTVNKYLLDGTKL